MKETGIAIVALLLWCTPPACAQDDDTIEFVHGLPVTGEDTAQQIPQDEVPPADSLLQLAPRQVPRKLREAFEENTLFTGWRKHQILLDKHTGVYWLHLREGNTLRRYGFTEDGNPVSIMENDIPAE